MKSLNASPDPSYNSVNLSVYAISEVFVGVFTACLPPLRKFFDNILKKALPASMVSSRTRDSCALKGFSNPSQTTKNSRHSRHSRIKIENDGDSHHTILEESPSKVQGLDVEIMRTTRVSIVVNDKASEYQRDDDWA
jgi:hypothetical protein